LLAMAARMIPSMPRTARNVSSNLSFISTAPPSSFASRIGARSVPQITPSWPRVSYRRNAVAARTPRTAIPATGSLADLRSFTPLRYLIVGPTPVLPVLARQHLAGFLRVGPRNQPLLDQIAKLVVTGQTEPPAYSYLLTTAKAGYGFHVRASPKACHAPSKSPASLRSII
jgi:hypothetical protein